MSKVTAFLPVRKGSQRVANKNFRQFHDYKYGLFELKVRQLIDCPNIDEIIISTTDELAYQCHFDSPKVNIIDRPQELGLSTTKTDDLVNYALNLVASRWFLWTHVTSPLFTAANYSKFIERSKREIAENGYDSSATVSVHRGYLFKNDGTPLFNRDHMKWPSTQSVEPVIELNNAGFFGKTSTLKIKKDRVGINPFYYECGKVESIDVDWDDDFIIAQALYANLLDFKGKA
jgi:CMP-N-acetylneuraminic acid synthetase